LDVIPGQIVFVIASEAKQSIAPQEWIASSLTLLAMTAESVRLEKGN
jgi:hypothetical protein